jgi:hypothetical protein
MSWPAHTQTNVSISLHDLYADESRSNQIYYTVLLWPFLLKQEKFTAKLTFENLIEIITCMIEDSPLALEPYLHHAVKAAVQKSTTKKQIEEINLTLCPDPIHNMDNNPHGPLVIRLRETLFVAAGINFDFEGFTPA